MDSEAELPSLEAGDLLLDPLVLVNSIPMPAVITNPRLSDNPIIACNEAFSGLTGYATAELIGRNCRFLAGKDTDPEARARLHEAIANQKPVVVRLLNYRKDGSTFLNALMIAPILGCDGKATYFMGTQLEVEDGIRTLAGDQGTAGELMSQLSPRQREILTYLAAGYLTKQIAFTLGVSESTVKMHRRIVFRKLGAHNAPEAVRIAIEAGLISGHPT
ncbi:PAS domain-containing protein [Altererythrobacter salegens]|uniref:PAS domain-containing protein n=1 Tax=Croceibacterium salegens TaxID=1737568 RepID=A0A6I4SW68_9SPHN|nr:LuxR C-terminal-related transcriptional regulator [Croceibacterium salegens]MXO58582.1 PAS domain-containing protein [Croceibacterium salegens]